MFCGGTGIDCLSLVGCSFSFFFHFSFFWKLLENNQRGYRLSFYTASIMPRRAAATHRTHPKHLRIGLCVRQKRPNGLHDSSETAEAPAREAPKRVYFQAQTATGLHQLRAKPAFPKEARCRSSHAVLQPGTLFRYC